MLDKLSNFWGAVHIWGDIFIVGISRHMVKTISCQDAAFPAFRRQLLFISVQTTYDTLCRIANR